MVRGRPGRWFCTAGLSFVDVGGVPYAYEDQGGPGRDGCDGGEMLGDRPLDGFGDGYIGFDCRIHDGSDVTDDTVIPPNRPDGTCGQ
jgi:hypothetical protein